MNQYAYGLSHEQSTTTLSSHQWQPQPPSPPTKLIVVQSQKALISLSLSFPSRSLQIENLLKSH
uniref:Uncharacterized protein n=1 Tax=Salix viminalis TaxID=40686 RepID=A0A6N2K9C2_SALVM